ncbi:N-acetylglucosamine-6-phosphate deacetylase [Litchfieldia alkalitelluris]|uniref:N-acetylglucosamine-6-phosphate deacetylase n=1 Tax=Litchfieldia alkalitelluris TaxID=304268 RepID=UPI0009974E7C|nr:N-acetylglucosamine-6-phosphate deacetylase [Litchfieldia alkalitelluris]
MAGHEPFILKNITVFAENQTYKEGFIKVADGKISKVGSISELTNDDELNAEVFIGSENQFLIPGMIDLHIHGAAGADTMDANTQALETMAKSLPKEGTTSFLATTITQSQPAIESALANAGQFITGEQKSGQAEVLGVHLEGPFISPKRAGAQPLEHITDPDVTIFKKWQKLAMGTIKLVTTAPEQSNGLNFVQLLKENGIVASIGHSDATYEIVNKAISAGASHITHLYNGMRGLHHREPGVAGAALLKDELCVEIISDGIHIRPEMILLTYKQKPKDKIILITDSIRAKGLKPGTYDLGGQSVVVSHDRAILQDGTLAGSILKMNDALKNFQSYTQCTIEELIQFSSANPAKQLGIFERKGSIAVGKDADLVLLNEDFEVVMTFCRGQLAFKN